MEAITDYIIYKGKKLFFKKLVQDPAWGYMIFLHDSLGCTELWRDFPEQCIAGLPVNAIIYDRAGYGRSGTFFQTERDKDYMHREAHILVALMDMWDVKKAILFGHSDGGTIALLAAALYPERFSMLFTEGAHIFVEEVTVRGIQEAVQTYATSNLKDKLMKYHGNHTEALFRAWTDTWLAPAFADWNIASDISSICCPVHVIQGADDEYGTLSQVDGIGASISHDRTYKYIIEGAKHTPHKERPSEVLHIVRNQLNTAPEF